ncbi:MAG: tetratricopeptide repeat protein [Sulfuricaulis sp.]
MMSRYVCGFISTVFVLLSGCAGIISDQSPATPVSDNTAVLELVNTAHSAEASAKPDAAESSLERALRIEPHNPALWQELAKLQLQQGQYQQAEGLAARSNGWVGNDKALRAENWRIIGEARLKRGDYPGAQTAFDKAAQSN